MKHIILIRYGEIILKGLNRPMFENKLVSNINKALKGLGEFRVRKSQGRMYVESRNDDFDIDEVIRRLSKVFGIVSLSVVYATETDLDVICKQAVDVANEMISQYGYKTFKVETKRGNKSYPYKSPEISRNVGGYILKNTEGLSVDVNNPDFIVYIEVREQAYIYANIIPGYGGMPVGTSGKAMLLLSGGIDSPVAGWMMAKRGVELEAVHFYSYPYTSERARDKVIELARIISESCYHMKLHIIPFTDLQLAIRDNCPEEELTIIMRRVMMHIAERLANESGGLALITGESVGQVASQTIQSLTCTNAVVNLPVFRPLVGMDKEEVVTLARKIDTFETSILPYEDCCTVFVAKHPKTKPNLQDILRSEKNLDIEDMIDKAITDRDIVILRNGLRMDYKGGNNERR